MLQYQVVYAEKKSLWEAKKRLEEEVKFFIDRGWKPQGGVGISSFSTGEHTMCSDYHYQMTQAMIKEE